LAGTVGAEGLARALPRATAIDIRRDAIALHLAFYNFVKIHGSLRCTPAMEAGIEKSAWTVSDLVNAA
jgi:hypothetical protein